MEKKIMDKIMDATNLVNDKIKANNAKVNILKNEVFTKEVVDMIKTFTNDYAYIIEAGIALCYSISDGLFVKVNTKGTIGFGMHVIEPSYTPYGVTLIEATSEKALLREELLNKIISSIPAILDDITQKYRKETEEEETRLNAVLNKLGSEPEPVRHIKVTVEWV